MIRRSSFFACIMILLFMMPVTAQDTPLSETFATYDSLLTVNYPQGWFVDSEADDFGTGFFLLANSAEAIDTMRRNSGAEEIRALDKGEVGIIVMRPAYLRKVFDYNTLTTPTQALEAMFGKLDGFKSEDIQAFTLGVIPAARYDAADERSAGLILAVDLGDGGLYVLAASTHPDDIAQFEPVVLDIAQSLHFGGAAAHLLIHDEALWDVDWSPNSQIIVTRTSNTGAKRNVVRLWDAETGEVTAEFNNGLGINWKPDNSQFVIWDVNTFTRVYDATTQESLFALPAATYANWNADGTQLITTTFGGSLVQVFEAERGRKEVSITAQTSRPTWERDGALIETRTISTGSGENTIQLWDAVTGDNLLTVDNAQYAVWNADQTQFMAVTDDKIIHVFDAATGDEVLTVPVETVEETDLVYDTNWRAGDTLISANVGRCSTNRVKCTLTLRVWDAKSGKVLAGIGEDEPFRAALWHPDGKHVLTLSREPNRALLWDAESGKVVSTFDHPAAFYGGVWNTDGSHFMTWSEENIVYIWEKAAGELVMALPHEVVVQEAAWIADETLIEVESNDGGLYFWDTETGQMLARIGHASKADNDVYVWQDWSPDGRFLVTRLSSTLLARVWDVQALTAAARTAYAASEFTAEEYGEQGSTALNDGDFTAAIAAFDEALRLDPDNAEIYTNRGVAHYQLDEITAAINDVTRAIHLKPAYARAYIYRGDMFRFQGEPERALDDYNHALAIAEDATVYNRRGVVYYNQKQFAEAVTEFNRAIELNPEYTVAYLNRGNGYYNQGKDFYESALADFKRYAELAGDKANPDILDLIKKLEG